MAKKAVPPALKKRAVKKAAPKTVRGKKQAMKTARASGRSSY